MISSRHNPIIRELENASDEQILEIKNQYIKYEYEYAKPINRVKRMIKRITRK